MDAERSAELAALASALSSSGGAAPENLARTLSGGDICAASRTPAADRSLLAAGWSLACLFAAFSAAVTFDAPVRADVTGRRAYRPVDLDGHDAVARVQEWVPAGDELPALQRLGGVTRHPGGGPAWSFERTGEDGYLVLYRGPGGSPAYAFEVDLAEETVTPSPEAADALALLRVDEQRAAGRLVAAAGPFDPSGAY
jgi:hypothetical protein